MKTCTKCGIEKQESEFYWDKKNGKPYLKTQCKLCQNEYQRKHWREVVKFKEPPPWMLEKQCLKCGEVKPVSEFHRDPRNSDGLKPNCKPCLLEICRAYSRSSHEVRNAYYAKISKDPAYKARRKAYLKKYTDENRQKHNARSSLWHHVKRGNVLKKPCEMCGELKVQAHHKDYSKPLDVQWFCSKHHGEAHRKYV